MQAPRFTVVITSHEFGGKREATYGNKDASALREEWGGGWLTFFPGTPQVKRFEAASLLTGASRAAPKHRRHLHCIYQSTQAPQVGVQPLLSSLLTSWPMSCSATKRKGLLLTPRCLCSRHSKRAAFFPSTLRLYFGRFCVTSSRQG